jgi:hypothetical protein
LGGQQTASARLATCREVPGRSETGGVTGGLEDHTRFEDASFPKIVM